MINVSNDEFLTAIFGDDAPWTHVTDFPFDPNNIPKERHLWAWAGDYYCRYHMQDHSNQYFTISHFYADDQGKARRRKALYRHTRVIVLDDVKEKLSMTEVSKLPRPAWVLETSVGSEQWGYILNEPCAERGRVENLLDGLVANGLAPDGRDPGMKGVTRYVRLPDGINNKSSKLVDGLPFKCRLLVWEPFNTTTLEALATPFKVNLDAPRREARVDGAAAVPDHPLLHVPDVITVKEARSDGRFDITCPWVEEHTGADDSGAAIFTNEDGTMGFKCHHGACQHRTGRDLMRLLDNKKPGFSDHYSSWLTVRRFADISEVSFMQPVSETPANLIMTTGGPAEPYKPGVEERRYEAVEPEVSFMGNVETLDPDQTPGIPTITLDDVFELLQREIPGTREQRMKAAEMLKAVDPLPVMDRNHWHDKVRDLMSWAKPEFKAILTDLREEWYQDSDDQDLFKTVMFVKELNQFYDWETRIFMTVEAFQNSYCHLDADVKKNALMNGHVLKVDRLDYAPKMPRQFNEGKRVYGNTWYEGDQVHGVQGDVTRWFEHWSVIGWQQHIKHITQWMAYTIKNPEHKINHMVIMGGYEGSGKDFLLYPLMKAMGHHHKVISGDELLSDFNDFALGVKYLHINETELGDRREALAVSNKLKPYAATPPETIRINQKGVKALDVRNIVNATMTTNSQMPLRLNGNSRRFYAVWSDLEVRDENQEMTPEWRAYWEDRWTWMKNGGWQACVWYLRNCVDLSDFNPGAAPPMTDFLRDIQESSKSAMVQTLEAFIKARAKLFQCDLMTSTEISETLRGADLSIETSRLLYCESKFFTPIKVGSVLKEMPQCVQFRVSHKSDTYRLWAVRDAAKYQSMMPTQLYEEYERQHMALRSRLNGKPDLNVV